MATIPTPGSELRHVRKTITFDGGAGSGAVGNVVVFTITGMVMMETLTAHATTTLASSGNTATLAFGSTGRPSWLTGAIGADVLASGDWWSQNENHDPGMGGAIFSPGSGNGATNVTTMESIILTVALEAVTAGVLVIDCWYTPITDDGALAGDDIDSQLVDAIWDEAQSGHTTAGTFGRFLDSQLATIAGYIDTEVAAIKAVTDNLPNSGALSTIQSDLDDIQTRLPAALVSGRMDSSVGAMAAAVITAAAIATDAIDADALAADAVTEIWAKAMTELSAAPAVTGTVLQALEWIFLLARNKMTQTASTQTLLKDDGTTTLSTSAVSDNGTTFSRGEWA